MENKKPEIVDTGCIPFGNDEVRTFSFGPTTVVGGHQWSGWPGAYCIRCGSEQLLEYALANNWFVFSEDEEGRPTEEWLSADHKELVNLGDNYCYADMSKDQIEEHKSKIKVLSDKIGWKH